MSDTTKEKEKNEAKAQSKTQTENQSSKISTTSAEASKHTLTDIGGFSSFKLGEIENIADPVLEKPDLGDIFTDGPDSFIDSLKNDSLLKNIFKEEQRQTEAIEEIKSKFEDFKNNAIPIEDLIIYFKKLKKFVNETDNETKIIDDFIKKLIKTANEKIIEECEKIDINDEHINNILGI